ncbi:MAG: aminodeoxychorismate synthase component I [Cytophagaceae bacterium]|nr:aminodeoxychorismate synthase component I [Cytophagaceae bacterium]
MQIKIFDIENDFKLKALRWASKFECLSFLNYGEVKYPYGNFPSMLAAGTTGKAVLGNTNSFEALKNYRNKNQDWLFGFLSYDLKNEIEKLSSKNRDILNIPNIFFFEAQHLFSFHTNTVEIKSYDNPDNIFQEILKTSAANTFPSQPITIQQKVSKAEYIDKVEKIKKHLLEGDIYELNYCMEFFADNCELDSLNTFIKLNEISPMPFSAYMKLKDLYLISASPERFLKKENNKLISQPIKGTAARGKNEKEDEGIKEKLKNSEKERAENMMIVDLVRNDLARSSESGSLTVDELFGIYTFKQVHQMISTISSHIKKDIHFVDAIKNAFPMGSMTGTPKIKAMQLIDHYEKSRRGLFSGAAGYITPEGDFDFNVVIRSIIYSASKKYLSYQAGSAITYDSDAEKEYEECMVKAETMRKALESTVHGR